MVPIPYEKLVALLAAERKNTKESRNKRKTARCFMKSLLEPQRSGGIRKISPSFKKNTQGEKVTGLAKFESNIYGESKTLDADPNSLLKALDSSQSNRIAVLPRLTGLGKPETESGKVIAKPAISSRIRETPPPPTCKKNHKSSSIRKECQHLEETNAEIRPDQKLKEEPKDVFDSMNHLLGFVRHKSSARRSSWPQICKGKGPRGLYNPHNYCYRRSVLQALLHLPAFLQALELHDSNSTVLCNPRNCTCVACGLRKLCTTYWASDSQASITSAVTAFDRLVNNRAPKSGTKFMYSDSKWAGKGWRTRDQMDAQEWCLFLLDQMVDPQIPRNLKSKPSSESALDILGAKVDPTSFKAQMKNIFELSYNQTMTCGACRISRRFHGLQKILGPVPLASGNSGQRDISSCLKQFFSTDFWEVKCENKKCLKFNKPGIKNRVTQSIVAAPEVLMIQLKCFMNSGARTRKKNPNIDFGHDLNLSSYASTELLKQEGELRYKLCSIVIHQGSSLEMGHYVGVFTAPNGQIHHISDEHVSKCSTDALTGVNQKGTPYILCYTRTRAEDPKAQSKTATTRLVVPPAVRLASCGKAEHEPIASAKLLHASNGPTHKISTETNRAASSNPSSKFLHGHTTPSVLPDPFRLSKTRPPVNSGGLKSTIPSVRDLGIMRDGRPKPSQQLTGRLSDYQGLSKNQIRKMKRRQRRLQAR